MYINDRLEIIQDNQIYADSFGNKYPENFPKGEIAELHKVLESPKPSDENLIVTGFVIDENYNQVWQVREKSSEELAGELKAQALAALAHSDMVALRCLKAKVEFPDEWKVYVNDLRDVIRGGTVILPVMPEYPQGS